MATRDKSLNRQTEELAHGLVLFGSLALTAWEPGLALGDIFQNQRPTGEIAQKILFRLPGLDRRTELLDGVIIDMEPVSPWHANIGDILLHILICRAALRRARENDGGPLGVQWGESRTLQFSPDFPTRTFAQY